MTNKPEVGKMYIHKDSERLGKNYARECLYVNENGFLLGINAAAGVPSFFFEHRRFSLFVEYKPPVIHKRYVQWYINNHEEENVRARCSLHRWEKDWEKECGYTLLSETEVTYEEKKS